MSKDTNNIGFVIVGEPKSGTTAMAHFLGQHPEVCMSTPKEPHFFATDHHRESDAFHGKQVYFHTRTEQDFQKLFSHAKAEEHMLGEASTGYLYSREAAKNIYRKNPDARIIAMFRNPVTFLHSLHMQYVNETVEEEEDFLTALNFEDARKKDPTKIPKNVRCPSYLFYSERYKYAEQLQRYLDVFPEDQILVLTHEEFIKDNKKIYNKVVDFLQIKEFTPDFQTIHGSKTPRYASLNKLIHNPQLKTYAQKSIGQRLYTRVHKSLNKVLLKPQKRSNISPSLYNKLRKDTLSEVKSFSKLTGKDYTQLWNYKKSS